MEEYMHEGLSLNGQIADGPLQRGGWCRWLVLATICLMAGAAVGCCSTARWRVSHSELMSPRRLDNGYTIVLPGILGYNSRDPKIVNGLLEAKVPSAIEVYDWTRGPLYMVSNLRGTERNRSEAQKVAAKIIDYQDRYPGRPVNLIGHSGGGGMAIMALEALPAGRRISGAILLAPPLAPDYDLRLALSHTETGIRNFYSYYDAAILGVITTAIGTMEGRHAIAAGAIGFSPPEGVEGELQWQYERALDQRSYSFDMLAAGHAGGHFGWTSPAFVKDRVAPLLVAPIIALPPVDLPAGGDVQMVSFRDDHRQGAVKRSTY